jgi:hypothetical protein
MHAPEARADRRDVDGEAGRGDMLGGLTTGAGGQLGLPDNPPVDDAGVMTIPLDPKQHTKDGAAREPDAAHRDQGGRDPA